MKTSIIIKFGQILWIVLLITSNNMKQKQKFYWNEFQSSLRRRELSQELGSLNILFNNELVSCDLRHCGQLNEVFLPIQTNATCSTDLQWVNAQSRLFEWQLRATNLPSELMNSIASSRLTVLSTSTMVRLVHGTTFRRSLFLFVRASLRIERCLRII